MVRLLVCFDLIFIFMVMLKIFCDANVIKLAVLSISFFLCAYSVISGLFFLVDKFSFVNVLVMIGFFAVLFNIFLYHRYGKVKINKDVLSKDCLLALLLVAITLLLTIEKFELYDSGQDQGLYQAEALELCMGNYEVQHDFEEYQLLEKEEDKAQYYDMLNGIILGYYPLSLGSYPNVDKEDVLSDVSGMYHGIQTFPALLALGGHLFGLDNMVQIQTVFLICAVLLLFFSLEHMRISQIARVAVCGLFALSPLVLWISKSSLTEMFLTMLIAFYLFMLTESDTKEKRYFLAYPLLAFEFVHVSFLQLFPIFVLIGLILYLRTSEKEYLWDNVIISIGLSVAYLMMSRIAPHYFNFNCSIIYFRNIITADNFLYWIYAGCIVVSVVSLMLLRIRNGIKIYEGVINVSRYMPVIIVILLIGIISYGISLGWMKTPDDSIRFSSYYGEGFQAFGHLALYAFAMALGYAVLPYTIIKIIKDNNLIIVDTLYYIIDILFIYCVLLQSITIRKDVGYYYYYSRYLTFYLPIIVFLFAALWQKAKKRIWWVVSVIALCVELFFDAFFVNYCDMTMLEWENLIDISESIEDNSAIILGTPYIQKLIGSPIRSLTSASIFPMFEDAEEELALLEKHYNNIYYIAENDDELRKNFDEDNFTIVYKDHYIFSVSTGDEIYPLSITESKRNLILYKYAETSKTMMRIDPKNEKNSQGEGLIGYYSYESDGVWVQKFSCANLYDPKIAKSGLEMEVHIPGHISKMNSLQNIEVYVNGTRKGEISLKESGNQIINMDVSDIKNDSNEYEVVIVCPESFVPSEIGESSDNRELALKVVYLGRTR